MSGNKDMTPEQAAIIALLERVETLEAALARMAAERADHHDNGGRRDEAA